VLSPFAAGDVPVHARVGIRTRIADPFSLSQCSRRQTSKNKLSQDLTIERTTCRRISINAPSMKNPSRSNTAIMQSTSIHHSFQRFFSLSIQDTHNPAITIKSSGRDERLQWLPLPSFVPTNRSFCPWNN
jgi:hypothetical protein